ncbi:MAG: ribulose-phosphate 3-epimerase, partial [Varibaculum cambriense]|nr:ribulose-phosphate 3-epimerase [Varibaculum cambriense]
MGVTISPSILNCDIANLASEIEKIKNADYAHVDVMDNHFVPNLSWGLPVVEAVIRQNILPVDAHLMIEDADRWAPTYAEAGCASVTFHAEAAAA